MHLLVLGLSHHTAPIELRERLAVSAEALPEALTRLTQEPPVGEVVVLSTCNRTEIYATCSNLEEGHASLLMCLASWGRLSPDHVRQHIYTRTDSDAARHLFRVAAGLDSLVVGEPQIFGQVKHAYTVAAERHGTGTLLNRLFHTAFTAGKRVRAETGLAEGAVSVSYAGLGLARKICGDLKGLTVLVVGAGDMAELTARHMRSQNPARVLVCSRTAAHAQTLADDIGGTFTPWVQVDSALASADIVVSATGATEPIISRERVHNAMRGRTARPLFIIDLGVPRDVDPAAARIEQVFLYNIDDLQGMVSESLARRASEVARAESIVNAEVEHFSAWVTSRSALPTLVALRQRFEAIRQAELVRLQPRLAALPPEARARIDELTRLIVEKLLITPTEQLKTAADRQRVEIFTDALTQLFGLGAEPSLEEDDERELPQGRVN